MNKNDAFSQFCSKNDNFYVCNRAMFTHKNVTPELDTAKLKDRITPHVTNFFRLRLTIEKQEGKRKYKSDGAVMVGEFVCMYVCSCTVSE